MIKTWQSVTCGSQDKGTFNHIMLYTVFIFVSSLKHDYGIKLFCLWPPGPSMGLFCWGLVRLIVFNRRIWSHSYEGQNSFRIPGGCLSMIQNKCIKSWRHMIQLQCQLEPVTFLFTNTVMPAKEFYRHYPRVYIVHISFSYSGPSILKKIIKLIGTFGEPSKASESLFLPPLP